jgi:hypothetical protein
MPASCASAGVGYWQPTHGISPLIRRSWTRCADCWTNCSLSGGTSAPSRVFSGATIAINASASRKLCSSIGEIFASNSSGALFTQLAFGPAPLANDRRESAYAPRSAITRTTSS